jgi:hypothetical protein
MSRRNNGWDNAVAESVFATLKVERIHDGPRATRNEATSAITGIEGFYNDRRRHSSLGYLSLLAYELRQAAGERGGDLPRTPVYTCGRERPGSSWILGVAYVSAKPGRADSLSSVASRRSWSL